MHAKEVNCGDCSRHRHGRMPDLLGFIVWAPGSRMWWAELERSNPNRPLARPSIGVRLRLDETGRIRRGVGPNVDLYDGSGLLCETRAVLAALMMETELRSPRATLWVRPLPGKLDTRCRHGHNPKIGEKRLRGLVESATRGLRLAELRRVDGVRAVGALRRARTSHARVSRSHRQGGGRRRG